YTEIQIDTDQAYRFNTLVAAYYKTKGIKLYDSLISIFKTYGYYQESLESILLAGKEGAEKISNIISTFRHDPPQAIANHEVIVVEDYETSERTYVKKMEKETIHLPTSNVLKYKLDNGAWVCLRPSGTEPLIKIYHGVKEASLESSQHLLEALKKDVMARVRNVS